MSVGIFGMREIKLSLKTLHPSILTVIYKTKALLSFKPIIKKDKIPRDILITHNSEDALAWFDGAAQKDGTSVELVELLKPQMLKFISGHIIVAVVQTPKRSFSVHGQLSC
jgi:hypothetical protein